MDKFQSTTNDIKTVSAKYEEHIKEKYHHMVHHYARHKDLDDKQSR